MCIESHGWLEYQITLPSTYKDLDDWTSNDETAQERKMAKVALSAPTVPAFLPNPSFPAFLNPCFHAPKKIQRTKIHANLGGRDGETKRAEKKKFITREEEPEQYWQTAGEREGENPMKTPLPYIIIFGMSTPFIILAIGFANGWIKVPVR